MDQINPDSNYRKYYANDPLFFQDVIYMEQAPFKFKIHLFKASNNSGGKYNTNSGVED